MLSAYTSNFCQGYILLSLILWAFAGYAYLVNARRPADDPKKRDFHPAAVFLAPITWPLFLLFLISIFIIKALLYGVFLVLFTIVLIAFRKPFILIWLDKIATKVGNILLEVNTQLIKILFSPWVGNRQPA